MDDLSSSDLQQILRFTSATPRDKFWSQRFKHSELADLAAQNHPLHSAALTAVNLLHLRPDVLEITEDWAKKALTIVLAFGPSVHHLDINLSEVFAKGPWVEAVRGSFTSLRSLVVHDAAKTFNLPAFISSQKDLEILALRSRRIGRDSRTIQSAASSSRLRRLRISVGRRNPRGLAAALAVAGRRITSLALDLHVYSAHSPASYSWETLRIDLLPDCCPQVSELELRGPSYACYRSLDVARAVMGYGCRLKKFIFNFRKDYHALCQTIVRYCPNVTVLPETSRRRNAASVPFLMKAFGSQLGCIATQTIVPLTLEEMEDAKLCTDLHGLALIRGPVPMDDYVLPLFHRHQSNLKYLRLHFELAPRTMAQEERLRKMLTSVAENTAALEQVGITATKFDVAAWLIILVERNKNLCSVCISEYDSQHCNCESYPGEVTRMLAPLLLLKNLRKISLGVEGCRKECEMDKAAIKTSLVPWRTRNVTVCINKTCYLR